VSTDYRLELCSDALVLIGDATLTSFSDDGLGARVASQLVDDVTDAALSSYPWRFATQMAELDQMEDDPADIWSYAYQLPGDFLHAISLTQLGSPVSYDRFGDKLFCDADNSIDAVVLTYIYRASIQWWLPDFRLAVIYDLASLFAEAVAARSDLAKQFDERAMRQYMRARSRDSQSQTNRKVRTSGLLLRR
jgi:hypothetical protein